MSLVYGLWPDLRLAYVNGAWARFANENGGAPFLTGEEILGTYVLDSVAPALRPFFCDYYARVLRERRPWVYAFECPSAELHRDFYLKTYPLSQSRGLLAVSSLRLETPHARPASEPLEYVYRDKDGILHQCMHCRRIRRGADESTWDWVPAWVAQQPVDTSHGLCAACFGYYYGPENLECATFPEAMGTAPKDQPKTL